MVTPHRIRTFASLVLLISNDAPTVFLVGIHSSKYQLTSIIPFFTMELYNPLKPRKITVPSRKIFSP